MKKLIGWMVAVVVLVGAFYLWRQHSAADMQVLLPVESQPAPVAQAEPPIRYPIQENDALKPLPALNESDPTLREALTGLLGRDWFRKYFQPEQIVRHIVVTIDNLPRNTVAVRLLPIQPAQGHFLTAGKGESRSIAPQNGARYTPFVRIAEKVNAKDLVAVYTRFYPLFQRAYQELGYPKAYFNDRLVAVIDHMLAAPEVKGPIMLVQPHVFYRFADPELEAASAGHKIMLRIGSENAARIKVKLREIRGELTVG